MRHWLKHLWAWVTDFPVPCQHAWGSVLGATEEQCLLCGKAQVKEQKELDWDLEMIERHPEWKDAAKW